MLEPFQFLPHNPGCVVQKELLFQLLLKTIPRLNLQTFSIQVLFGSRSPSKLSITREIHHGEIYLFSHADLRNAKVLLHVPQ